MAAVEVAGPCSGRREKKKKKKRDTEEEEEGEGKATLASSYSRRESIASFTARLPPLPAAGHVTLT